MSDKHKDAQGDSQWQKLFDKVAIALNCLPSGYIDGNEHVIKAAQELGAKFRASEGQAQTSAAGWQSNKAIRAALHGAVAAIYFDDNSDYGTALWGVVAALAPELIAELISNPSSVFDKTHPDAAQLADSTGGGERMKSYIKCLNCGHCRVIEVAAPFSSSHCPVCASTRMNVQMTSGPAPDWWSKTKTPFKYQLEFTGFSVLALIVAVIATFMGQWFTVIWAMCGIPGDMATCAISQYLDWRNHDHQ